jgi:hypothetical protein
MLAVACGNRQLQLLQGNIGHCQMPFNRDDRQVNINKSAKSSSDDTTVL